MALVEALKDKRDVDLMKTVLRHKNIRHYLLFTIGCNTGMRIGDLLKLKVNDFVTGEKQSPQKYLYISEQKTGKSRQIAINSTIQKAMKLFLSQTDVSLNDYLFVSRKGKNSPISTTQAYRILNDAAVACNLSINIGSHTMRKTWGFFTYIRTGKNIGLVMDLLNHSSPAITLRYIGITQDQRDSTYMSVEI